MVETTILEALNKEAQNHLDGVCDVIGSSYRFDRLVIVVEISGIEFQSFYSAGTKDEESCRRSWPGEGKGSEVSMPIIVQDRALGTLTGEVFQADGFDARAKMMVEAVLENAVSYLLMKFECAQKDLAVSRMDELSELSLDLVRQVDFETTISIVFNAVVTRFKAWGAAVWFHDEASKTMELTYLTPEGDTSVRGWKLPLERIGSNSTNLLQGESFITEDYFKWLAEDQEYYLGSMPGLEDDPAQMDAYYKEVSGEHVSLLGIPLQVDAKLIGTLVFLFHEVPEDFRQTDSSFLSLVGKLVGIALDKTRYIEGEMHRKTELEATLEHQNLELKEATLRMRQAMEAASKIQEHERERLSWDLHDNSNQIIAGIGMRLSVLKKELSSMAVNGADAEIEAIQELVKDLSGLNKEMIETLNPSLLKNEGLESALPKLLENMFQLTDIEWKLESTGDRKELSAAQELALFRIVQEAVRNAIRHSHARKVSVKLLWQDSRLVVAIQDDGIGIHRPQSNSDRHYGMQMMAARTQTIDSELTYSTPPEGGFRVEVTVPL